MADDTRVQLDVRVDFGGETIQGTVNDAHGPAVEFSGWLGLMSAFDSACLSARRRVSHHIDPSDDERS